MANPIIADLVSQLANQMNAESPKPITASAVPNLPKAQPVVQQATIPVGSKEKFTVADYPIMSKHPDMVISPTNKNVKEITLDKVMEGEIANGDVRISRQMLLNQADVAESAGKVQIAGNLRRAAELTEVPDEEVIAMYDLLRPNRATKQQLVDMAQTLRNKYNAALCAQLVLEACEVYEKRGILLK